MTEGWGSRYSGSSIALLRGHEVRIDNSRGIIGSSRRNLQGLGVGPLGRFLPPIVPVVMAFLHAVAVAQKTWYEEYLEVIQSRVEAAEEG